MNRNNIKIIKLVVSLVAIILGVYMSFLRGGNAGQVVSNGIDKTRESRLIESEEEMVVEKNKFDYSGRQLPMEENISEVELYGDSEGNAGDGIYFSNVQKLDEGSIPLETQAVLISEVASFLKNNGYGDVTELYIEGESYSESQNNISFICYMDGYADRLQIIYQNGTLECHILPDREDGSHGEE